MKMIDPPNGDAFGFPKPFDEDEENTDLNTWLLANGYPQDWIDLFPDGVPCRIIWTEPDAGAGTEDQA